MALDAVGLQQPLRYTVDLKEGLVQQPMSSQLMKGDKKANRVIVRITNGSETVDLAGVGVSGSFIRPPDEAELTLAGNANGNEAVIVLDDLCYAEEGYCEIDVKLTINGVSRTILALTGYVLAKGNGAYIDVGNVIPNIDDIIAQYAEMEAVTERTLAAAQRAEALAINASGYAANTGMLGGQPPSHYAKQEDVNQLFEQMVDYRTAVNLFDNSNFVDPVMQAGFDEMHGSEKYVIDRWLHLYQLGSAEKVSGGIALTGADFYISQKIGEDVRGKTLTFAVCLADGTVVCGAANVGDLSGSIVFAQHKELYLMLANGYFSIRVADGNTYTIRWAALYEGKYTAETLPPYVPREYVTEFAACRRFYRPKMEYLLRCYANGYLFGEKFSEPMRLDPTPTELTVYTETWDEMSGSTVSVNTGGINRVDNSAFVKGEYYRVWVAFTADL